MKSALKNPSAWVPITMSLSAFLLTIFYVAIYRAVHHEDEDTPARFFQLLMVGQIPIIAFFVFKYLPKIPRQALLILILQFFAAFLAFITVFIFEL
jgi:hypothetical protein